MAPLIKSSIYSHSVNRLFYLSEVFLRNALNFARARYSIDVIIPNNCGELSASDSEDENPLVRAQS